MAWHGKFLRFSSCVSRPPSFVQRCWKRSKRNGAVSHSSRCKALRCKGAVLWGGVAGVHSMAKMSGYNIYIYMYIYIYIIYISFSYTHQVTSSLNKIRFKMMMDVINEVEDIEHGFEKWRKFCLGVWLHV